MIGLNCVSNTEAGLVSINDVIIRVMWTEFFLGAQGYKIDENLLTETNKDQ
jgi:hypothetical protein